MTSHSPSSTRDFCNTAKPDPKLRAYSKLIGRLERELSLEFGLEGCAAGGSTRHGISNITLYFNHRGTLELEELEKIVILCAERMVQRMNEDEKARPYLANYPVTIRNVTTGIFNLDSDGRSAYTPYPGFVGTCLDELKISYYGPENKYGADREVFEMYQEVKSRVLYP